MFPTIGHTHRSYWRNGDTTAHLDVRPWPIAQRFVLRRSKVHTLYSGWASQFQNMAREAVQLQSQLNAVEDFNRYRNARLQAWAEPEDWSPHVFLRFR